MNLTKLSNIATELNIIDINNISMINISELTTEIKRNALRLEEIIWELNIKNHLLNLAKLKYNWENELDDVIHNIHSTVYQDPEGLNPDGEVDRVSDYNLKKLKMLIDNLEYIDVSSASLTLGFGVLEAEYIIEVGCRDCELLIVMDKGNYHVAYDGYVKCINYQLRQMGMSEVNNSEIVIFLNFILKTAREIDDFFYIEETVIYKYNNDIIISPIEI